MNSEPNYPLVAVEDFFNVRRGNPVFQVPARGALKLEGLSDNQQIQVPIDSVDAIVGNPPYVRQENIDQSFRVKDDPKKSYKEFLKELFQEEWGKDAPKPSARSDIYVHFWPHSAHFLPESGYLGFLTGSGWLDNEFGFKFQEFILERFQVLAVLESAVEPWFTEARVNTAATILRRTNDPQTRANNNIKFVQLRQKLSAFLPHTDNEAVRQQAVDALVSEIEGLTTNTKDDRWRVRVVNQGELTLAGWEFENENVALPENWDGDWSTLRQHRGRYAGTKWSIHLRAPDLFFEILDTFGSRLVPLREVATVKYGVKSGADGFFYVQDITDTLDNETLAAVYGLARNETGRIRVVKAGDGSAHLIEAEYLQPLVFSVMELDGPKLQNSTLKKKILIVDGQPDDLEGTFVLKYIKYGEREGYHQNISCLGRIIKDEKNPRAWYELRDSLVEGDILWPKAHQYRHIVTFNPDQLPVNARLYAIKAHEYVDAEVLGAILNSTLTIWFKEIFGRVVGREGNTDTMVFETKQMLVVDPSQVPSKICNRLKAALDTLMGRSTHPIYPMGDELAQADRVELDDAVFEALGIADPDQRQQWRERVYTELKRLYKRKRELEEIAQENRVKAARSKRTASARSLAKEIWQELDKSALRCFPRDFVLPGTATKEFRLPEGKVQVGRELFTGAGSLGAGYIMIGDDLRYVGSMVKAEFVQTWQEAGNTGSVFVPEDDQVCREILEAYQKYQEEIQEEIHRWARSRTDDERLQMQVIALLWKHIGEYMQALEKR